MLFQSQFFILVFLPASLLAYYLVAQSAPLRQWVLIAASLFFYGWWDVRFIPLLLGQIGATWLLALLAARTNNRAFLIAGICVNLISLGTFKYLLCFEVSTGGDRHDASACQSYSADRNQFFSRFS